ncbi:single-stranded-DNA-specific exonuclease RecJ, partial [bacterium]|nr:single-stranded-DNA-specific exonuclease RecJ [bacterium]
MNNGKEWKVMPRAGDDFFKKNSEYSREILQLLFNRGITDGKDIKDFLNAEKLETPNPFDLSDMGKAVDLIIDSMKRQEKIAIYGDYDADGITSSALL